MKKAREKCRTPKDPHVLTEPRDKEIDATLNFARDIFPIVSVLNTQATATEIENAISRGGAKELRLVLERIAGTMKDQVAVAVESAKGRKAADR